MLDFLRPLGVLDPRHTRMANPVTKSETGPGLMRKQHSATIRTGLPRYIPPEEVVAALRTYAPIMRNQPLVTHYEPGTELAESIADPFFYGGCPVAHPKGMRYGNGTRSSSDRDYGEGPFETYDVYERIPLIPGLASKEISFPVTFQDAPGGIRCRADAPGGVTLWAEFKVQPRPRTGGGASPAASVAGEWEAEVDRRREHELVEWVTVETNALLMPFVARTMEEAHREICRKVVDEVAVRFSWE